MQTLLLLAGVPVKFVRPAMSFVKTIGHDILFVNVGILLFITRPSKVKNFFKLL